MTASLPFLHVVTDDPTLARPDFVEVGAGLLGAGGPAVALHLRGPATPGARLEALAAAVAARRALAGGWLVVNDRVDVAGAVEADAVQLGARSLPLDVVRRLLPGRWIGVSVHGAAEARAAADADWLVAGTIYATPSHPGRPGAGPGRVAEVAAASGRPVVAIGGIGPERIADVRAAGAVGVAVLRGVWGARDPLAALGAYLSAWSDA